MSTSTQKNLEKAEAFERIPMTGSSQKLQLSESEQRAFAERGYVPRWFNDVPGRIAQATNAGWTFVSPEHATSVGAGGLHQENTDQGSQVSKVVNTLGTTTRAYLMEIKKEWWDESQALKEEKNARVDQALEPVTQGGQSIEGGYTPK